MPEFAPDDQSPQARTGTLYGYVPSEAVCIVFIVLFSLTGIIHLGQAVWRKMWWLIPTMFTCALTEVIGWSGRLWSSKRPGALNPYLMQICCTILAPSFMTAALFIILGKITIKLGQQFSRLTPNIYSIVFITMDLIALVVQAIGGAKASLALTSGGDPEVGAKVMVGGIVFQIFAITLYVLTALEFLLRFHFNKPLRKSFPGDDVEAPKQKALLTKNIKYMLIGMGIATVFLYIRSIYRTIELLDGWTGPIITNQLLFNVLDGMPITVAMFTMNLFHPGWLLNSSDEGLPSTRSPDSEKGDRIVDGK